MTEPKAKSIYGTSPVEVCSRLGMIGPSLKLSGSALMVQSGGGADIDICPDAMYLQLTGKSPEEVLPALRSAPADA
jgi:hypothetical protein